MHFSKLGPFLIVPLVAALAATGCGQGSAALSPTGPTGSPSGAAFTADSVVALDAQEQGATTITTLDRDDKGKGGGKPPSEQNQRDEQESSDSERGKPEKGTKGELSGFVTAVTATSLTVRGVTVTPAPDAVIRHGNRTLLLSAIVVGDHVQARGTMSEDGLLATEIKVEQTGKEDDQESEEEDEDVDSKEHGAKVEGVVSGRAGDICPNLSLVVGTVNVTTTSSTKFDDVTCDTLADGVRVEVKGDLQADGSIVATKIEKD